MDAKTLAAAMGYTDKQVKNVQAGGVSDSYIQEQITNNPTVASKVTMDEVNTQVNELLDENGVLTDIREIKDTIFETTGWAQKEITLNDGAINLKSFKVNSPTNTEWKHAIIELNGENELNIQGTAGTVSMGFGLYAFYDKNDVMIGNIFGEDSTTYKNLIIKVPVNAKKIIINTLNKTNYPIIVYADKEHSCLFAKEEKFQTLSLDVENLYANLTENEWVVTDYEVVDSKVCSFDKTSCTEHSGSNTNWEYGIYNIEADVTKLRISGKSGDNTFKYGLYAFYDDNDNRIGDYFGIGDNNKSYTDLIIDVPNGATKIYVNSTYKTDKHVKIEKRKIVLRINDTYKNKKILFMGDSITALNLGERGWCKYFNEIIKPSLSVNVAVASARWCDYSDTVHDGNPVFNGEDKNHNNTMSNQIEKLLRGKDETNENYSYVSDYDDFDIIMIAMGTNDSDTTASSEVLEDSFTNSDGTILDLSSVVLTKYAGAFRYAIENLQRMYPNAKIFICTPIQRATGGYRWGYNHAVIHGKVLKELAGRMSLEVIDTFECGIYNHTEIANANGLDLIDGLHPNAHGAKKIGVYNAKNVIAKYI